MEQSRIEAIADLKSFFSNVLTPQKIKGFRLSTNHDQMVRDNYLINDLLVICCQNLAQINSTNQHVDKLIKTTKDSFDTMGITKGHFDELINYIRFIEHNVGYEKFVTIHDDLKAKLENKTSLKAKLNFMGLDSKINEKELIKLYNEFDNIIINNSYFPLNYMEQILDFRKSNTKLSTFNESTFLVLNSIFLEHCLFETKDVLKVNKLMEQTLVKSMLNLPEYVIERIKSATMAFGEIADFINYGFTDEQLVDISNAIFVDETIIKYVERTVDVNSNPSSDTPENTSENTTENEVDNEVDKPFLVDTIEQFYADTIDQNTKGIIDPKFILFNAICEANGYHKYETKEKLISCIEQLSTQKDSSNQMAYVNQISQLLQLIDRYKKTETEYIMVEFDAELFNELCEESFDIKSFITDKFKELHDKITEFNIVTINPVDASIIEKIEQPITELLSNGIFSHFDQKGIAISVLEMGVKESLSSYMNLVQLVELLENASVKGRKNLEHFEHIHNVIKNESVMLSFNIDDLSSEDVENITKDKTSLREYKLFDIFKTMNDITTTNHITESYVSLNKLFK